MGSWLLGTLCILSLCSLTLCCYNECVQKFTLEMESISLPANGTTSNTTRFCKAMSSQIQCLNSVMTTCPSQQRLLVQSMLTIFIQPDYQRTCEGEGNSSLTSLTTGTNTMGMGQTGPSFTGTMAGGTLPGMTGGTLPGMTGGTFPSMTGMTGMMAGMRGMLQSTSQTLMMCSQRLGSCRATFNSTFTSNMAIYNISGLCQSLKNFTLCCINLLSTECGQLLHRGFVYSMQQQYGTMCSEDAQANTHTMIECTNKTMQCYMDFNSAFAPAVGDYNLMVMCRAIDSYTQCVQAVSTTDECAQFTTTSLAGIARLKQRHHIYCGDDNGNTSLSCVQSIQDCYIPFNMTFFPALHSANLTLLCSSLNTYTSCVARLKPMCSQQLGGFIQSAQTFKVQYTRQCHPSVLKLASCEEVGKCNALFYQGFATHPPTMSHLCGSISEYFSCTERGLDACQLPQSTSDVEFGALGILMKEYCSKVSSNSGLLRCPSFMKCSTVIWVSFSPTMKDKYEGSTWCTFMQLSVGCAEHALQASDCFLDGDLQLQKNIEEVDQLRVRTCEKGIVQAGGVDADPDTNLIFSATDSKSSQHEGTDHGSKDAAASVVVSFSTLLTGLIVFMLAGFAPELRLVP